MKKHIVIIGGGPTGLGCAWRLKELGMTDFALYEANDHVGGLSASFLDDKGFTWDVGGHVLFSHYPYFDELFDKLTGRDYLSHLRASWIRIAERFVPYPFQNNLRYLPKPLLWDCLKGLHESSAAPRGKSRNFREWIMETFGEGIARHFMLPYNEKVWAQPLEAMSKEWIAERVSVVDFEKMLHNVIFEKDDVSWGPNNQFKFPRRGGTGSIYQAFVPLLDGHIHLNRRCVRVNTEEKRIHFENTESVAYDILVNTAPLDQFCAMLEPARPELIQAAGGLCSTSGLMLGVGFKRPCPSDKCWMYFPEDKNPIYRLTYFSNYSPGNAPEGDYFSLMGEISYSPHRPLDLSGAMNAFIDGLVKTDIIREEWKKDIVTTSAIDVPYSYPVPTLERNASLQAIIPALEENQIFSRGRFGLWLYEIGNMDHSVMQGVELASALTKGEEEETIKPYPFLKGVRE